MRKMAKRFMLLDLLFLMMVMAFISFVWAQTPTPVPTPTPAPLNEWAHVIAAFINSGAVLGIVQLIKKGIPWLNTNAPWLLPIIAGAIGPGVAALQNWISTLLGVPIDLSPIAGIFTGGTAVAIHQIGIQASQASRRPGIGLPNR